MIGKIGKIGMIVKIVRIGKIGKIDQGEELEDDYEGRCYQDRSCSAESLLALDFTDLFGCQEIKLQQFRKSLLFQINLSYG